MSSNFITYVSFAKIQNSGLNIMREFLGKSLEEKILKIIYYIKEVKKYNKIEITTNYQKCKLYVFINYLLLQIKEVVNLYVLYFIYGFLNSNTNTSKMIICERYVYLVSVFKLQYFYKYDNNFL